MQALYTQRDNVKALGWLHGFCACESVCVCVCVSVYAPAEIYCNVSAEAAGGLKALSLIDRPK